MGQGYAIAKQGLKIRIQLLESIQDRGTSFLLPQPHHSNNLRFILFISRTVTVVTNLDLHRFRSLLLDFSSLLRSFWSMVSAFESFL